MLLDLFSEDIIGIATPSDTLVSLYETIVVVPGELKSSELVSVLKISEDIIFTQITSSDESDVIAEAKLSTIIGTTSDNKREIIGTIKSSILASKLKSSDIIIGTVEDE